MRLKCIYTQRKKTHNGELQHPRPSIREGQSHQRKHLRNETNGQTQPESLARTPSRIKGISTYLSQPDIISLGSGFHEPEYFFFDDLTFTLACHFDSTSASARRLSNAAHKNDIAAGQSN